MKNEYSDVLERPVQTIENHTLAIETLKTSSTGQTLYEILKNKGLLTEDLKKNFVGLCHDGASSFTCQNIGLSVLLKKNEKEEFFDLWDPCHCYALVLEGSLSKLPANIMLFINDIHSHFNYSELFPNSTPLKFD